jgi:nucleotide-binding universal stress UspA family protein
MDRIVVGVVDRPAARAALRWAGALAHRTGARLVVVSAYDSCWRAAAMAGPEATVLLPSREEASEQRAAKLCSLRRLVLDELGGTAAQITFEWVLRDADPRVALVEAAEGADVLVVGASERRGWRRSLRRSLAGWCTGRTACPVVAVPAGAPPMQLEPEPGVRPATRRAAADQPEHH